MINLKSIYIVFIFPKVYHFIKKALRSNYILFQIPLHTGNHCLLVVDFSGGELILIILVNLVSLSESLGLIRNIEMHQKSTKEVTSTTTFI